MKPHREQADVHGENKNALLSTPADDSHTYAMYATPSSTSVPGSNGALFASVCTTAVGKLPVLLVRKN